MVTEATELQDDIDLDSGFGADDEVTDELLEEDGEPEPSEETPDPLAEVRSELGALKQQLARFADFDPQQVKRDIGHVRSLQSKVDSLTNADPLKAINPRVATAEEMLGSLVDALIESDSDLIDDRAKTTLRAARDRLAQSKTEQEWERREAELLAKVGAVAPPAEPDGPAPDQWGQATRDALDELAERMPDFDPASIPTTVWIEGKAKGTPARAVAHVLRWAEQQATEPVATRTATRRQAAGNGSPPRSGGLTYTNIDDAEDAFNAGELDFDAYKRIRDQLGVKTP